MRQPRGPNAAKSCVVASGLRAFFEEESATRKLPNAQANAGGGELGEVAAEGVERAPVGKMMQDPGRDGVGRDNSGPTVVVNDELAINPVGDDATGASPPYWITGPFGLHALFFFLPAFFVTPVNGTPTPPLNGTPGLNGK